MLHTILRMERENFFTEQQLISLRKRDCECFLCDNNSIYKYMLLEIRELSDRAFQSFFYKCEIFEYAIETG